MNAPFQCECTRQEQEYLHTLVRLRIGQILQGVEKIVPPPPPDTPLVTQELGAFVTLKLEGRLRGCIGNLVGKGPLYATVAAMAEAAAFHDPRFPPLSAGEFPQLEVEISVMGPISLCPDPQLIVIGRHGLIICCDGQQGLLLPQVPVEWKWDRLTFLAQTCKKANLPPDTWKNPAAQLFWFEACIF